jgi:hypothetical protein
MAMPLHVMSCLPPRLTIVLNAVPAPSSKFPTVCRPPLLTVVPIALPPVPISWEPPLLIGGADRGAAGGELRS